jgi:hypothetical protein
MTINDLIAHGGFRVLLIFAGKESDSGEVARLDAGLKNPYRLWRPRSSGKHI